MTALRSEDDAPRGFVPRAELYRAQQRIEALEAELEAARDTLGQILGQDVRLKFLQAGFTRCEAALIAAMWARPLQPSAAMVAAYSHSRSADDADIDNLVKVRVCNIRKKARAYGCPGDPVETLWGSGYALSEIGRQWFSDRIGHHAVSVLEKPASGHPGAIMGYSGGRP